MRVLWLSPWMRTLARVHGEALRTAGAEVLLVTSEQHPQQVDPLDWEKVLDPRPKTPSTWPQFAKAAPEILRFRPNIVVAELVRDPRWMTLAPRSPRVTVIHDDRPHDSAETVPPWEATLFGRWQRGSVATLCFSEYVAHAYSLGRAICVPTEVVPLSSDVADEEFAVADPSLSIPVATADRRDFVMAGRLNGYKNLSVVLRAWWAHTESDDYRGDTLWLFGAADVPPQKLPPSVRWNGGTYTHAQLLPVLARAKASVVHYRVATQSGVQVLGLQAGVASIVSDEGALPEYQPVQGVAPIGKDDVAGLAAAFDTLADPDVAAAEGVRARAHYDATFAPAQAGPHLAEILSRYAR